MDRSSYQIKMEITQSSKSIAESYKNELESLARHSCGIPQIEGSGAFVQLRGQLCQR